MFLKKYLQPLWKSLLGGPPAAAPTRFNRKLQLETLEDRLVPTVVFQPQFGVEAITKTSTNEGIQSAPVYLDFAGPYWLTAQGQQDETTLRNAVVNITNGPYLSGLVQYGSDGVALLANSFTEAKAVPMNDTTSFGAGFKAPTLQDLYGSVQDALNHRPALLPSNSAYWRNAPIYVVVSDPVSSNGNNGGWNHQGQVVRNLNPLPAHFIWIGTSMTASGASKDNFTQAFSHELAETYSDPVQGVHGIEIAPRPGSPLSQIGDNEPAQANQFHYAYRLGDDLVQPYWSRQDKAYIVPDGNQQQFSLAPVWNGNTFSGNYNLTVKGDQSQANQADLIRVDSVGNKVQATLNGETATFDAGRINTVNVDTEGGHNRVQVASVPARVTLNVDSFGPSNDWVNVGNDLGSLAGIRGTVGVFNSSGRTFLSIDAGIDAASSIGITSNSVSFSGGPTIMYQGGYGGGTLGVTSLNIYGNAGIAQLITTDFLNNQTYVDFWGCPLDTFAGPGSSRVHWHWLL